MKKESAEISIWGSAWMILGRASLRPAAVRCLASAFYNFFFCQYRAALFLRERRSKTGKVRGKIPVSRVDHELDEKIPFNPDWIAVYLDFVAFWIRTLGFLLKRYGKRAEPGAADFLDSMGRLYAFAGQVYGKNLSTTKRPFYIRRPRFLLIHAADPHLMCVPSLHVMVVIRTYTKFADLAASLEPGGMGSDVIAARTGGVKRRAQDITEAILYVKQHSVNCVAAAMYAMTRFDGGLFPREEAEDFLSGIFSPEKRDSPVSGGRGKVGAEDGAEIRNYIGGLYARFLAEGTSSSWEKPLLDFLLAC
ncbi:MAG: hypothetical protein LBT87_05705 [Treponema sp.]|jgi:hypothetical protein|nr:hypothetical protein [Treponema sp.]